MIEQYFRDCFARTLWRRERSGFQEVGHELRKVFRKMSVGIFVGKERTVDQPHVLSVDLLGLLFR